MNSNKSLIDGMAGFKSKAKERHAITVSALLGLLWPYRRQSFSWADSPDLEEKANSVLAEMDDRLIADMEASLADVLDTSKLAKFEKEANEWAGREIDGEDARFRLDRHADHLKELIALWLGIAVLQNLSKDTIEAQILTYGGMPQLSPYWQGTRSPVFEWGKGYQRNLVNAITVIGQDYINGGYQYARIQEFKENGAVGYRTARNSTFNCPFCDEMTQHIWPLDEIVLPYHPRCVCVSIPVYEDEAVLSWLR